MYKLSRDYEESITEKDVLEFLNSASWLKTNNYLENKIVSLEEAMVQVNDIAKEVLDKELHNTKKYLENRNNRLKEIKSYPEKMRVGAAYKRHDLIIP